MRFNGYAFGPQWTNALRFGEPVNIQPGSYAARIYLESGWSLPTDADEPEDRENRDIGCWTDRADARILILIREPADRVITFGMNMIRNDEAPETYASTFLLNGEPLPQVELQKGYKMVRLTLPAALQRVGLNELQCDFPYAARPGRGESRVLSASIRLMQIQLSDKGVAKRRAKAAQLIPEGSRYVPGAGVIEQISGSTLTYYVQVHAGDRLRGQVVALPFESSPAGPLELTIRATPDEGAPTVWFQGFVEPKGGVIEVDAATEVTRAQPVRIDLEIARVDGRGLGAAAWVDLRLDRQLPDSKPATEQASEEFEQALEQLRGAPILAILIDAANPDYISGYGGRAGLTPTMDKFMSEGTSFQRAYAPATYTIAAISSLFTSRYPWEHGAWNEKTSLIDDWDTWAEAFAAGGYRTEALVHAPNGSDVYNYPQGFDSPREVLRDRSADGYPVPRIEQSLEDVKKILSAPDERPLFLWAHYVEPHEPYTPPAPYFGSIDSDYEGEFDAEHETLSEISKWNLTPGERDLQHIVNRYQEGYAYLDAQLARVMEAIEDSPIGEEAIVVLLSDHGEAFLRHRGKSMAGLGHRWTVYEDMSRIPLIFRLPGGSGSKV